MFGLELVGQHNRRKHVIPAIHRLGREVHFDQVCFQQDDFPVHNTVREYFEQAFNALVISGTSNVLWPARLSDLTKWDFFLSDN